MADALRANPAASPSPRDRLTLSNLVDRLGPAAGAELFQRVDGDLRQGQEVVLVGIKQARAGFSTLSEGRARIVKALRPSKSQTRHETEAMVLIGMRDLEAVVKASDRAFSWADAFAPRADLAPADQNLPLRPGARGRNLAL